MTVMNKIVSGRLTRCIDRGKAFKLGSEAVYIHGRRDRASGRISVLLRLEKTELRSKLVAANVLALGYGCHREEGQTNDRWV
jgi:hypothetical protein